MVFRSASNSSILMREPRGSGGGLCCRSDWTDRRSRIRNRSSVCQGWRSAVVDRRAERGRATREQLVAVATELFAQRGFDGTSIEAVLERAGVSRGSLYHHFENKEALFEAALDTVEARIGEAT